MNLNIKMRYARKPVTSSCLLVMKSQSIVMEVKNISASGIMLAYDEQTEITLKSHDFCILEIIINYEFSLNVEAEVTRIDEDGAGLKFIKIPEDKQIPLWELLGEHVDKIEQ
ncbi:MAG: PilZ domain-containing protein [Proteobacteria bacterium]|nr:PilZ domain-containing protein [Pseudomonadota bacterium]